MNQVNLFVIGVNKAGTSWLYYLLDHHPDVFMADAKELYYFGSDGPDEERPRTRDAYHRHFPFDQSYQYFGDATVMYYKSAATADEIRAYNPDAKLLAIVRDPIQRLLSQFQYNKQLGLIDEATSLSGALPDRRYLVRTSHYEETLPAYTDRFGTDQFRVVSLEAGRAKPGAFWGDLLDFLDLPNVPRPKAGNQPENPTGSPAFRAVYRSTVRPLRRHFPQAYRWLLGTPMARHAKLALLRLLGTAGAKTEVLAPEVKEQLQEEFAPTYAYLRDLGFEVYTGPQPGAGADR
ncbi:sulfotransferase family protein [Salinibacter altiplanensis]|uniref:sulfotransferase family protein n=1 Tax=Salinibacter altiplanensis TaxID=1803181 RepID=UPI000C9F85ED|nr:sulfotransferase [Salinibacter altiplanensis]